MLKLISGESGDNSNNTIYWNSRTVWNNDGDTDSLFDSSRPTGVENELSINSQILTVFLATERLMPYGIVGDSRALDDCLYNKAKMSPLYIQPIGVIQ